MGGSGIFHGLAQRIFGYGTDYERLVTGNSYRAAVCHVLTSPDTSAVRALRWYAANAFDDSVLNANTADSVLPNNWATRLATSGGAPVQQLPVPQAGVGTVAWQYSTPAFNLNRPDWLTYQLSVARAAGYDIFFQDLLDLSGAYTAGKKVVTIPYGCAFEEFEPDV